MSKNNPNRYNVPAITSQFEDYLVSKNLSKISRKNYISDLRMFLTWIDAQEDELEFNLSSIVLYKQFLQTSRLPVQSINRSLSSIRAYGDLLVHSQEQFSNPARLVANIPTKIPVVQSKLIQEFSRSNELSKADALALFEFLNLSYDHT